MIILCNLTYSTKEIFWDRPTQNQIISADIPDSQYVPVYCATQVHLYVPSPCTSSEPLFKHVGTNPVS